MKSAEKVTSSARAGLLMMTFDALLLLAMLKFPPAPTTRKDDSLPPLSATSIIA